MDSGQWRTVRRRLYMTLPWAGGLAAAYGLVSEQEAALWVGLVGAAIGPAHGMLSAVNTPGPDGDADMEP